MSPKKLLFYTNGLNPGSPEIGLVSLLGQLSPREYEVDLILFNNQRIPGVANLVEKIPDWVNVYDYVAEKSQGVLPQQALKGQPADAVAPIKPKNKTGKRAGKSMEAITAEDTVPMGINVEIGGTGAIAKNKARQPGQRGAAKTETAAAAEAIAAAKAIVAAKVMTAKAEPVKNTKAAKAVTATKVKAAQGTKTEKSDKAAKTAKTAKTVKTAKAAKTASPAKTAKADKTAGGAPKTFAGAPAVGASNTAGADTSPYPTSHISSPTSHLPPPNRLPRKRRSSAAANELVSQAPQPLPDLKTRLETQVKISLENLLKTALPARKSLEMGLPYSACDYARAIVANKVYDWAFSYGEWVSTSFVAQDVKADSKAIWVHGDEYSRGELANLLAYEGYYNKIVFVSPRASAKSVAYVPLLADKAAVVENFCDQEYVLQLAQEPVEDFCVDERPLIVTIANIRSEQNCWKLLDVARGLKEGNLSFHWVCINNFTDKTLYDRIRKRSAKLGLSGDISWIDGAVNPYKYLRQSHVLASLSDHESWCTAIPEAKILGVPVVATRTGDALRQITDSVDGVLTDFSADEICGALRNVLKDQDLQGRIRKNLKEREPGREALEQFSKLVRTSRTRQRKAKAGGSTGTAGVPMISTQASSQVLAQDEAGYGTPAQSRREAKTANKAGEASMINITSKETMRSSETTTKKPGKGGAVSATARATALLNPVAKEEMPVRASRILHTDNRTLIVLDNVNYRGGSHRSVRNLLRELGALDMSVFTAVMPTLATLKEWGHVKFVFPPDELWEAHLLPDLLSEEEPPMGLTDTLTKAVSQPQTLMGKARMLRVCWKRLTRRKQQQMWVEYELRRKFSQYDTVCVIGEDSAYREIVANCNCRTKIAWIYTDYAAWKQSSRAARTVSRRDAYIYARYNYIVFASAASREGFIRLYPQLATKTRVIGNAMPVEAIRAAAQKSRRKLKIVTVGMLDAPKGMERLLKVAARLIYQGYDFNWNIIGSGPMEAALRKKAKAMNIQGYINFLGEMANPYHILAQADLFALFSQYEGLPNTVYEALILGIPVIATRVGGISEQVVEGRNGWLVGNSEEEILRGLRHIFDNPEELDSLRRKMPLYHYDNTSVIEQVQDLFL
ncbi:MAG: glycosyltransferase [Gracilibacteraceae bacterium]|jgi:glycosyltransferase involved in cell wall biosynthesis|nr:glycosyltransferase [Gracilibacteraceae bacterium]